MTTLRIPRRVGAVLAAGAAFLAACGGESAAPTSTIPLAPRVTVTSVQGDPQSELIATIYARVLEEAGFRVARKDAVDLDRAGYIQAIADGEFQLIPDMSLPLKKFLWSDGNAPVTTDPATTGGEVVKGGNSVAEQLLAIETALPEGVSVSGGSLAEQKNVVACTPAYVKASGDAQLITITNLLEAETPVRIGATAAMLADTSIGFPALVDTYSADFVGVEIGDDTAASVTAAVKDDTVDCFLLDSLDPALSGSDLEVLADDKAFVSGNAVVALLAGSIATPDLLATLESVATVLTTSRLNGMLVEILVNGTDPSEVGEAFWRTVGSTAGAIDTGITDTTAVSETTAATETTAVTDTTGA